MKPNTSTSKQRFYASLVILGSGLLLSRTITMISQGAIHILVSWVFALLILELIFDASCLVTSAIWLRSGSSKKDRLPLRLGTVAALVHVSRVLKV